MSVRSELRAWQAHTAEAALFFDNHGGDAMTAADKRQHAVLVAQIGAIADALDAAHKRENRA